MRLPLLIAAALLASSLLANEHAELFEKQVRPLLNDRCIKCHGPEKQKGQLRLDSREAALKGGESGPAVVVGKPEASPLIKLVHHSEEGREMPPKEKLSPAEIKSLETWIKHGAVWTALAKPAAPAKTFEYIGNAWTDPQNPIVKIFHGQRLDLWSLRPLAVSDVLLPLPSAISASSAPSALKNSVDAYVSLKTKIAPEADRRTLIRRLSFNLTGLPSTNEETQAFIEDKSPDAYEKLVERLLASPAYGEHWARMWLDAARYSDSNGFDWDEYRKFAWRFRDYVIRSLNADKPFDRFVREQLAGDEMFSGAPKTVEEQDALIATAYLRLGPWDNSAGSFREQDRARQQWMNDLVETTGGALLGMTMSCCRCHDHKTDPLSQEDFYRFAAFFEPLKFADDLPLDLEPEQAAIREHNAKIDKQLEEVKQKRNATVAAAREKLRAERKAKLPAEDQALLDTPEAKRDDKQKKKVKDLEKKIEVSDADARKASPDDAKKTYDAADEEYKKLKKELRTFMTGLSIAEGDPKPVKVLSQGNLAEPKQEVVPGFLSILNPNPAAYSKPVREKNSGRRTALADWIVSPHNPLTARVLVNRVWQAHFGTGIVATSGDFGFAGAKPTNSELLDWLALEFIRGGWSLKKLNRLIVTSAAFRQSNGRTGVPARQPRRLTAEQLRDSMLAVSGVLKPSSGGAPVWPALPQEVLKANPAFLDDNDTKTKGWYPSPPEQLRVRSIYVVQKRTVPVPFMETFDLPNNSVSCPRRNLSTVAPQALTLLNNPMTIECATAFAKRVEQEAGADATAQIRRAFSLAMQRQPDDSELKSCAKFRETRSLAELCRALMNLNEFVYFD